MNDNQTNGPANNDDLSVLPDGFLVLDESGKLFQVGDGNMKPFTSEINIAEAIKEKDVNKGAILDTGMEEPMLQPPPPAIMKKSASFYFHPDDEEEVGIIANKSANPAGVRQFSVQKIIEKAENNFGLKLNIEEKKKFLQLILTAMRDRRSLPETEKLLNDSTSPLGMGFPATLAGGVIVFLSQVKDKITKEGGLVVDETQVKIETIVSPELVVKPEVVTKNNDEKTIAQIGIPENSQPAKKLSVIEEIAKQVREEMAKEGKKPPEEKKVEEEKISQSPVDVNSSVVNRSAPINIEKPTNVIPKMPTEERPVAQNLSRFVNQSRPAFNDIKSDNRSLGPIDELALMNIATFRRLSSDVNVAAKKIGDIINALGKQSLARKTLGIKAWRSSPLYKQYLSIGQLGMESGKQIPDVINELITKYGDGLSISEFEAVGDINRLIRL